MATIQLEHLYRCVDVLLSRQKELNVCKGLCMRLTVFMSWSYEAISRLFDGFLLATVICYRYSHDYSSPATAFQLHRQSGERFGATVGERAAALAHAQIGNGQRPTIRCGHPKIQREGEGEGGEG